MCRQLEAYVPAAGSPCAGSWKLPNHNLQQCIRAVAGRAEVLSPSEYWLRAAAGGDPAQARLWRRHADSVVGACFWRYHRFIDFLIHALKPFFSAAEEFDAQQAWLCYRAYDAETRAVRLLETPLQPARSW